MRPGAEATSQKYRTCQSLNLFWLGACQFTGLVLRLTISLIFLSINDL